MKISIIAFTDNGVKIANKLLNSLSNGDLDDINLTRCKKGALSQWTEEHFSKSDALVFIGAIGIATRAIAPFIKSKTKDPAIVVVDELGHFSIPLLSGHIGGANELAIKISEILFAIPVITTATDINNVFAIDTWAKSQGLRILNPECIKLVSSKLLKGETIHIKTEYPIKGNLPENIKINDLNEYDTNYDVKISHKDFENISVNNNDTLFNKDFENISVNNKDTLFNKDTLYLIPSIITVGIGCKKNIDFKTIEKSILNALKKENCHVLSLNSIASIDKKANEKGILEFSKKYDLPFKTYSAEELNSLKGDFTKSEFVKSVVKVDNVCERSAIIQSNGKLLRRKDKSEGEGVTIALAIKNPILSWEE
ncbi:cobalt-precorrin 5A hydrolase [Methanobrevibacter olleyae]|uniref:Cobalamin biosynthesis protein CbiG n=1 Tax=Methanobrevibacter olleyae TaxID=294671 RepID=A0A126QYA9_METOL|nr:cobalt-precorrin 5A hydrolase [Methanobrevibacter olleyae]AMK14797.1 cobalamin biosynthesis protein CbiG [Methanobrevibacter olleyae]